MHWRSSRSWFQQLSQDLFTQSEMQKFKICKSSLTGLLLRLVCIVQGVRHPPKLLYEHLFHQPVPVNRLQQILFVIESRKYANTNFLLILSILPSYNWLCLSICSAIFRPFGPLFGLGDPPPLPAFGFSHQLNFPFGKPSATKSDVFYTLCKRPLTPYPLGFTQSCCEFFDINVKKCVNVCCNKIWHITAKI